MGIMNINFKKLTRSILFLLYKLYDFAIYIIYPPYCAYCKKFLDARTVFCEECITQIKPIVTTCLSVTKKWRIPVIALSAYKKPLSKLILAKGQSDRTAAYQLGQLLWERTSVRRLTIDYIIPIPLHWSRYARRGYNQSSQIANYLAQRSGSTVYNVLKRVRNTKFQSRCNGHERFSNVSGAFCLQGRNMSIFHDKHIMLVDDLMTTGSTSCAAVRELIKLRPASITVVVACKVIQN